MIASKKRALQKDMKTIKTIFKETIMNDKTYLMLLSSFIACSSWGMQYKDLPVSDLMRYSLVKKDQFSDIYAVEQEITKGVSALRDASQLTQEAVLTNIENALKPYESKPDILPTLQRLY